MEAKPKENCSFTLGHFKDTLKNAISKGYVVSRLQDYGKNIALPKVIFLRHDVDFDLGLALKMAQAENEIGVKSTYFVRLHAGYNPFSLPNYKAIKSIISMGHEIALHHETGFSSFFEEDDSDMLKKEKEILESITGKKIEGISLHEPARVGGSQKDSWHKKFGFKYDAYSKQFTSDIKYISDSSARWREGCMCNFINSNVPKLCILVHPFWWYEKSPLENY